VQGDTVYVVTFNFTNHQGRNFIPQINKCEDLQKIRHAGTASGVPALAGLVSNSDAILKKDETREYTVGFVVYQNTTGTLLYDTS